MFGFKKNKQNEEPNNGKSKKRKLVDKLIMGAVIGGAIGSVLGFGLTSKKDITKKVNMSPRDGALKPEPKGIPNEVENN